jgi:hypothetical protein
MVTGTCSGNQDSFAAYLGSRHEAIVERVNMRKFKIEDFRLIIAIPERATNPQSEISNL